MIPQPLLEMDYGEGDRPEDVTRRLEEYLIAHPDDRDAYLQLVVLYFEATDGGVVSRFRLSQRFVDHAWARRLALLDGVDRRFGASTETAFWRSYMRWVNGGDPIDADCEAMAQRGDSLMPYLYLYTAHRHSSHREKARELFLRSKSGITPLDRYIRSLLWRDFGEGEPPWRQSASGSTAGSRSIDGPR